MEKRKVTILNPPLVEIQDVLRWGVPEKKDNSKMRHALNSRLNSGIQISDALHKAYFQDSNLLFVADDTFGYENTNGGLIASENEICEFLVNHPVPPVWRTAHFEAYRNTSRVVIPDPELACSQFCFSEKKIFKIGRENQYLGSECGTKWAYLVSYIQNILKFDEIVAYFPEACAKGVCSIDPLSQMLGIQIPITIWFTNNKNDSMREYKWHGS